MDSSTVTIIAPNGAETPCDPTFEAVKAALDNAFIKPIRVGEALVFVDEEGLLKELPINMAATRLANQALVGKVAYVPKGLIKKVLGG